MAKSRADKMLVQHGQQMVDYLNKVIAAHNFAKGFTGESWNGAFIMGLALSGLVMIPMETGITRLPYWVTAPSPKNGTEEWGPSWIAEHDALSKPAMSLTAEEFITRMKQANVASLSQIVIDSPTHLSEFTMKLTLNGLVLIKMEEDKDMPRFCKMILLHIRTEDDLIKEWNYVVPVEQVTLD